MNGYLYFVSLLIATLIVLIRAYVEKDNKRVVLLNFAMIIAIPYVLFYSFVPSWAQGLTFCDDIGKLILIMLWSAGVRLFLGLVVFIAVFSSKDELLTLKLLLR